MKIKIVEDKKDLLIIEIEGARHTIPGLIREALLEDGAVDLAAYEKKHPMLGNPKVIIKAKDPRKALLSAIKRAEDAVKEFEDEFRKQAK